MVTLLYSEVNILCILILVLILHKVRTGVDRQNSQRIFLFVLVCNMIVFIIDLIWVFVNYGYLPLSVAGNFALNAMYFIMSDIAAFGWLLYAENIFESKIITQRKYQRLAAAPVLILIVLILLSYKTGWIFYIDEANGYHRGSLNIIQILVAYGYIGGIAVRAFVKSLKSDNYVQRRQYGTLAKFGFLPFVFGMVQVMIPGIPLSCIGITASLLWVYLEFQDQRISLDPLTLLNNRNQLEKYLSEILAHPEENQHTYILMMDLDGFKKINDRFGHVEGDRALVQVADVLKKVCTDGFIGRYGGDEFIIICESKTEDEIKNLCSLINQTLAGLEHHANREYQLCLSIGYAKFTTEIRSFAQWITNADRELYRIKQSRK